MALRDYRQKTGKGTGPNRFTPSVLLIVLIIIVSLPMTLHEIVRWYKYVPIVFFFLAGTIIFSKKAYQGISTRHLKIFPDGRANLSNEAGFVGGKTSNYISGTSAQIVGVFLLLLGFACFGFLIRFLIVIFHELL